MWFGILHFGRRPALGGGELARRVTLTTRGRIESSAIGPSVRVRDQARSPRVRRDRLPVASMIVMWRTALDAPPRAAMKAVNRTKAAITAGTSSVMMTNHARANALEVLALGDDENLLIHGRTSPSRRP